MSRKDEYNFETKVGVFVFLALVLLIIVIFSIGDFYMFKPGYTLKIYFNYAGGLEVGAPVRLAGVKVGEIKKINVVHKSKSGETIVSLEAWIENGAVIKSDSLVTINRLGLVGETYLEISPGVKGQILKDQGILIGKDPIPVSMITSAGYEAFKKLDKTADAINDLFEEEKFVDFLKNMALNSKQLTENLIDVTDETKTIMNKINKGEGTLGKLLTDDLLYNNAVDMIEEIKAHPWKLLHRPPKKDEEIEGNRGYFKGGFD